MAKKIIGLIVFVALLVLVYQFRHRIIDFFREDRRSINTTEVKLLLRQSPSPDSLAVLLENKGIVSSKEQVLDYIRKYNHGESNFSAGKYIILPQTRLRDLVEGFIDFGNGHGKAEVKVNVIIGYSRDIYEMAADVSQYILADSVSIVDHLLKKSVKDSLGLTEEELPSLFIPAKYEMYFDTEAPEFIAFMKTQHDVFWNEERMSKLKEAGLKSPAEAVTLASIVHGEAGQFSEEWPTIARLYLNRLKKGDKLQSDPTFRFCWGHELDGVERLLNKHKEIDCPYNTYIYKGLPPGPISIPPVAAIEAVLNPDNNDYFFMMAKPGGGGHNFAVSYSEHQKNVKEYKKWLTQFLKNR